MGDDAQASARAKQRLRSGLRLAHESPASVVAAAYLVIIGFAAVLAPVIAPWNPNEVNYNSLYEGPSAQHLLGTDDLAATCSAGLSTQVGSASLELARLWLCTWSLD